MAYTTHNTLYIVATKTTCLYLYATNAAAACTRLSTGHDHRGRRLRLHNNTAHHTLKIHPPEPGNRRPRPARQTSRSPSLNGRGTAPLPHVARFRRLEKQRSYQGPGGEGEGGARDEGGGPGITPLSGAQDSQSTEQLQYWNDFANTIAARRQAQVSPVTNVGSRQSVTQTVPRTDRLVPGSSPHIRIVVIPGRPGTCTRDRSKVTRTRDRSITSMHCTMGRSTICRGRPRLRTCAEFVHR